MTKIKTFSVEEIDSNARLDKFLAHKVKTITRTQIKKIILSKNLSVNDRIICSPSQKVKIGDKILFSIPESKNEYIKPEKIKIEYFPFSVVNIFIVEITFTFIIIMAKIERYSKT